MQENLNNQRKGLTTQGLRTWGTLLSVAGIFGTAVIQNGILGMTVGSTEKLLETMQSSGSMMMFATLAIVLQLIQACAVPIFVFLLLEGFLHTASVKKYLIRVVGLAVISEIPYNLAYSGSWLNMGNRNPVFALAVCLLLLYFYRMFPAKGFSNMVLKAVITVAAFLWISMLKIDAGGPCVLMTAVLWALRDKPNFRILGGCTAAFLCTVFSPYYLIAPMIFIALHMYNGEKSEENRVVSYLWYPVTLLVFGLVSAYLI